MANQTLRTDTFTASGNWTCPAGVTSATVEDWGAGGGGTTNVGAGGGGAFSRATLSVIPGNVYSVTVGTSAINTNGGNSIFGSGFVEAEGGKSGGNGGAGGLASNGTGTFKTSGGNGALGTGNKQAGGAGHLVNGSGATGGTTSGGYGIFSNLSLGKLIGGGGASALSAARIGARGEVRISYFVDIPDGYPYITATNSDRLLASNTVVIPTADVGDLILVFVGTNANTITTATGWTKLGETSYTTLATLAVFYKTATASNTMTLSISGGSSPSYQVFVIKNWQTPTMNATSGNSINANPPIHTLASIQKALWFAVAAFNTSTSVDITVLPTGYDSLRIQPEALQSLSTTAVASATKYSQAISENPGPFTSTTEQWVAATIAVPGVATTTNNDNFFLVF